MKAEPARYPQNWNVSRRCLSLEPKNVYSVLWNKFLFDLLDYPVGEPRSLNLGMLGDPRVYARKQILCHKVACETVCVEIPAIPACSTLHITLECSTLFASGKFSAAARQHGVIRNRRGFIPFAYSSSRSSVIALSTVSVVCKPNSSWGIRGCVAVRVCSGG